MVVEFSVDKLSKHHSSPDCQVEDVLSQQRRRCLFEPDASPVAIWR